MNKRVIFTSLMLFLSISIFSQSDEDLIRHTLHNYFNGTAYNYLEQIEAAFHTEAELYLENREGNLWKMTAAEYIALFKDNEPGKFNGRYSKIMSIDQEGNLAQVKAEILMPKRNRRYIDVFIMKKITADKWVIVSKAANSSLIMEK